MNPDGNPNQRLFVVQVVTAVEQWSRYIPSEDVQRGAEEFLAELDAHGS